MKVLMGVVSVEYLWGVLVCGRLFVCVWVGGFIDGENIGMV